MVNAHSLFAFFLEFVKESNNWSFCFGSGKVFVQLWVKDLEEYIADPFLEEGLTENYLVKLILLIIQDPVFIMSENTHQLQLSWLSLLKQMKCKQFNLFNKLLRASCVQSYCNLAVK